MTCINAFNKNNRNMIGRNKSKRRDHNRKFLKPSMRSLFKTIYRFLELANIPRVM